MYRNVHGKIPDKYAQKQTWYILVCTETNLVHTGTYQYVCEEKKW
jgi:hypothetical protein